MLRLLVCCGRLLFTFYGFALRCLLPLLGLYYFKCYRSLAYALKGVFKRPTRRGICCTLDMCVKLLSLGGKNMKSLNSGSCCGCVNAEKQDGCNCVATAMTICHGGNTAEHMNFIH